MAKRKILIIVLFFILCKEKDIERAKNYLDKGKIDEAESILLHLQQKKDCPPEAYLILGELYLVKGEYYKSLKQFQNLPHKTLFKENLEKDLFLLYKKTEKGAREQAFNALQLLFTINPDFDSISALEFYSDLLIEKNKKEDAIPILEKILRKKREISCIEKLMKLYIDTQQWHKVLSLKDTLLENKEITPLIHTIIGEAFFFIGKKFFEREIFDSSLIYLKAFTEWKDPVAKLPEVFFLLGEIYYFNKDFSNALIFYREVLKINPSKETGFAKQAKERIIEIEK